MRLQKKKQIPGSAIDHMTPKFKNMKMNLNYIFLAIGCVSFTLRVSAQRDTTRKTTIDITSAYKPILRNAVKINLSASQLNADTTRPSLVYNIPPQNLFYSYRPVALKPAALESDSNLYLGLRNYLKVGFGNFSTPYLSAGFSFGDGRKSLVNLYADYISSRGNIQYQDYSQLHIRATGSYFMPKSEFYGAASFSQRDNYLYGYDHKVYNYKQDSIRQQFQDIELRAGLRNTVEGEYGIHYNPNIRVTNFTNANKLTESGILVKAPIEKHFGNAFSVNVEGTADISSYHTVGLASNTTTNNTLLQVSPSLRIASPRFSLNGGIIPTWDNGGFVWLPNVYGEAQIQEKVFLLQAGWVGRLTKNTFRSLSGINPYIQTLSIQVNTKEIEYYGGIKATLGSHFNFNAKAGWVTYTNLPLFINDTATDSKAFKVSYESKVNDLRVHGDLSYVNQDKFTVTAGLTFNGYTGLQTNARAWNTVPMEFTGSLRWWAFDQVLLKTDFYAFGGGNYLSKGNIAGTFNTGTDLSAGVEFKVNKMFSAWLDVNNILNNKYERWHNYQVYGLNLLGGVRVSF